MNDRRRLLIVVGWGALTAPFVSPAQAQSKISRVAFIVPGRPATAAVNIAAFKDGMRENGMLEGKHYVLDVVYAEGKYDRFPALTNEVLKRDANVILANTILSVRAAQEATKTVPILFVVNDPVGTGLVASLARPGGNSTGFSTQNEDAVVKFIELLRELLPRAKRVAVLVNANNPSGKSMFASMQDFASRVDVSAKQFEVTAPESFEAVFNSITKYRPDALLIPADSSLTDQRDRIAAFALNNRISTVSGNGLFVTAGGLISYGPDNLDIWRRLATYVKKVITGTKPADLPVEQPTKFELAVNAKTAKTLGIKIPQSILVRADKVIE
jgi:putative ABC transport system substrate-binding protein